VDNDYVFQHQHMGTQHSSTAHFSPAVAPQHPKSCNQLITRFRGVTQQHGYELQVINIHKFKQRQDDKAGKAVIQHWSEKM